MNELIRDLISFLSQDTLTVEDVVARIGPVTNDPGIPMSLEMRPTLVGVRSARLARYPDSGVPYLLTLEFAPDARPTVAELKATFGDYHRARTGRGRPISVIFYPPAIGTHWQVALIAELLSKGDDLDPVPVTTLALRRDPLDPPPQQPGT